MSRTLAVPVAVTSRRPPDSIARLLRWWKRLLPRAGVNERQGTTPFGAGFRVPGVLPIVFSRPRPTLPRRRSTATPYWPSPFRFAASRSRPGRMAISAISPGRPSSGASRRARGVPACPPTDTASSAGSLPSPCDTRPAAPAVSGLGPSYALAPQGQNTGRGLRTARTASAPSLSPP